MAHEAQISGESMHLPRYNMKRLLLLLLLTSCSMSELIDTPLPRTKVDTTYIPRQIDTTQTSGVPIGFDVTISDWEEDEEEINF